MPAVLPVAAVQQLQLPLFSPLAPQAQPLDLMLLDQDLDQQAEAVSTAAAPAAAAAAAAVNAAGPIASYAFDTAEAQSGAPEDLSVPVGLQPEAAA